MAVGVLPGLRSGWDSNASTWSSDSTLGNFFQTVGDSRFSEGSSVRFPVSTNQRQRPRTVTRILEMERGEMDWPSSGFC